MEDVDVDGFSGADCSSLELDSGSTVNGSEAGTDVSAGRAGASTVGSADPAARVGALGAMTEETTTGGVDVGSVVVKGFVGTVPAFETSVFEVSDSLEGSVVGDTLFTFSVVGVSRAVSDGVSFFGVGAAVLAAAVAAVDGRFLLGFSSIVTIFPTCFNCTSLRSTMPLQNETTGPSSRRLCKAASLARRSSSRCFSASSHRLRLLEFLFSTISASFSLSA